MVISHSGESHRRVEGDPSSWKEPVKKSVELFANQKTRLRHQISHLEKRQFFENKTTLTVHPIYFIG